LGGKRKSKVVPPPPPPKKSTAPTAAKEGRCTHLPILFPTSLVRNVDQELREDADSFVSEAASITLSTTNLGEEKVDDDEKLFDDKDHDEEEDYATYVRGLSNPMPDEAVVAKRTYVKCANSSPSGDMKAHDDRDVIARKEQEAASCLALLSSSILTAQEALANIDQERIREEERRDAEIKFTNAATLLQASARRMNARYNISTLRAATTEARIYSSAARIQSLARGVMIRRRVKAEISSVIFLQAFARGTIIRNRKKACDMAITPMQAIVRGYIDRKKVKVIKWYRTKPSKSKSSDATRRSVSFVPSSSTSFSKGMQHEDVTGDMINLLLEATQGSDRARGCAIAAKKVLIRNTSLYVSFINSLLSAQVERDEYLETVFSVSTCIDAIMNELLCFLAMLVQDSRQVFIPSSKIYYAHSVLVEECPQLYVEVCKAMGCESEIPMVDTYYTIIGDEDLKARYELTRASYAVFFKSKPPLEFWPAPSSTGGNEVGVSIEDAGDNHLFFLNEESLYDDDTGTFNDYECDDDKSGDGSTSYNDWGNNIFDMNPTALVQELRYLAEDQGIDTIVNKLRNVGLKVEETAKKAASNQNEDKGGGGSAANGIVGGDYNIVSAFMGFFD